MAFPCRLIGPRDTSWRAPWTSVGLSAFPATWRHWSPTPVQTPSVSWRTCFSGTPRTGRPLLRYRLPTVFHSCSLTIWTNVNSVGRNPFQSLRYSYFHVGQALGTPQQILEQGRPQPGRVQLQLPLQQQQQQQQPLLLLKPMPPTQPPPSNQHCTPSRPLQQVAPPPASAASQAASYQRHTGPKHIPKPEQTEVMPQSHLPYIVDKSLQSKVSCLVRFYHIRPEIWVWWWYP